MTSPVPSAPDPDAAALAVAPSHPRRLVYFGTPDIAVPPLRALHEAGHEIVLVVTRADNKRGRGGALHASPVKAAALDLGLPVSHDPAAAATVGADLGIVVAFGRILTRSLLEQLAMLNLHFSLLPRWRGAAPVERAILAGDAQTGVGLMGVEEGLDTGPIYAEAALCIGAEETADELRGRLVDAGTELLLTTLRDGIGQPRPQVGETRYAAKIEPAELQIDWTKSAAEINRLIRLGGAWTTFRGKRVKVWRAQVIGSEVDDAETAARPVGDPEVELAPPSVAPPCGTLVRSPTSRPGDDLRVATGDGWIVLLEVQPEGKKRQDAAAWANGTRPNPPERLGP